MRQKLDETRGPKSDNTSQANSAWLLLCLSKLVLTGTKPAKRAPVASPARERWVHKNGRYEPRRGDTDLCENGTIRERTINF